MPLFKGGITVVNSQKSMKKQISIRNCLLLFQIGNGKVANSYSKDGVQHSTYTLKSYSLLAIAEHRGLSQDNS